MPRIALLLSLCAIGAACASTSAVPPDEESTAAVERAARQGEVCSLEDLARSEGLRGLHDPVRNRWLYTRGTDRVLVYPGTTIAVVNGRRILGLSKMRERDGECWLLAADAARIRAGLRDRIEPLPRARAAAPAAPERAKPKNPAAGLPAAVRVALGRKWRYVVLHHSATTSGNAAEFHRHHKVARGWDGLGYHFVIGNGRGAGDGELEVGYRWTRQLTGAHAGRPPDGTNRMNEEGIGICLVGNFNQASPSVAQRRTLRALLDYLGSACGIAEDHVVLHRDIRGTDCPGKRFPTGEFSGHRAKP